MVFPAITAYAGPQLAVLASFARSVHCDEARARCHLRPHPGRQFHESTTARNGCHGI
jgi:hypothetical protein